MHPLSHRKEDTQTKQINRNHIKLISPQICFLLKNNYYEEEFIC